MLIAIGKLAESAGVAISTIRFYERERLLVPTHRTGSNYRQYDDRAVDRLKFIRAAQGSGFKLDDIREMLSLTHSDDPPCKEIEQLIEHRLTDVRDRLKELRRVERVLSVALKACCRSSPDWCNEIERLKGKACAPKKQERSAT